MERWTFRISNVPSPRPNGGQGSFGTDSAYAVLRFGMCCPQALAPASWSAVAALRAMGPRDAIEGMHMAQMLLLHEQVARLMSLSRQADLPIDLILRCVSAANSCAATFQAGMETLSRFRSGGKEQVVVSHVAVEAGGQAAIAVGGDIRAGKGEGVGPMPSDRPHALRPGYLLHGVRRGDPQNAPRCGAKTARGVMPRPGHRTAAAGCTAARARVQDARGSGTPAGPAGSTA